MKEATRGSHAWWQQCGEIKDTTWGNDAKFHLFIFFSKVALMGPRKFKNRACLMEKRAEGEREEEQKRAETGGVLCGWRMQFEIGQIAFFSSPPSPWPLTRRDMHRRGPWAAISLTPVPTPPSRSRRTRRARKSAWWNKSGTPKRSAGIWGVIDESRGGRRAECKCVHAVLWQVVTSPSLSATLGGEGSAEAGQKETSTCDICQFGAECDVDAEDVWWVRVVFTPFHIYKNTSLLFETFQINETPLYAAHTCWWTPTEV